MVRSAAGDDLEQQRVPRHSTQRACSRRCNAERIHCHFHVFDTAEAIDLNPDVKRLVRTERIADEKASRKTLPVWQAKSESLLRRRQPSH